MEPSTYHDRIVALGKLIVSEFENERGAKTLPRWIAYRIAELIESAKCSANSMKREEMESECQELILKLWTLRNQWPRKGFTGKLSDIVGVLSQETESHAHYSDPCERSFLPLRNSLRDLAMKELDLCLSAEIANFDLSTGAELLAQHRDQLSSEEISLITALLARQESLRSPMRSLGLAEAPVLMGLTENELVAKVKVILKELAVKRDEYINALGMPITEPKTRRIRRKKTIGK